MGLSISGGTAADQAVDLRYGFVCVADTYCHVLLVRELVVLHFLLLIS